MEQKKSLFDVKSFLLGVCICLVAFFFIGGARPAAGPDQAQVVTLQKPASVEDETLKLVKALDAKVNALDEKLTRVETKVDAMWKELWGMLKKIGG